MLSIDENIDHKKLSKFSRISQNTEWKYRPFVFGVIDVMWVPALFNPKEIQANALKNAKTRE